MDTQMYIHIYTHHTYQSHTYICTPKEGRKEDLAEAEAAPVHCLTLAFLCF